MKLQICVSNRFITIQIFSIFDRICNRCCIWSLGGVRMKRNVSEKQHNKKAAPKSTRFKKTKKQQQQKTKRKYLHEFDDAKIDCTLFLDTEECDVDNGHCNCKWWNLNVSRNSAAVAQKEMFVTSRRTRRQMIESPANSKIVFCCCFNAETNKQKRDRRASNLYNEGLWYSTT